MFNHDRTRRANRLQLVHHILVRLRGRGWFSSRQVWQAAYYGGHPLHRYAHTRVRALLAGYVEAGILERDDHIAACPLYRHRDGTAGGVDREALEHFEAQAWRRWSPSHDVYLRLIMNDLDRLIPRQVDPCRFTASGAVLPGRCGSNPAPRRQESARPALMGVYGWPNMYLPTPQ